MNSSTVTFFNPGEIDSRLISTMGCNVKETDNPIGFFGTGLKYALAVLARERQQVTIWSGLTRYNLEVNEESIRGKVFEICYLKKIIDEHGFELIHLGFTTELGKQWGLDQAYRELFCNAKDEGGDAAGPEDQAPSPRAGSTVIQVTGQEFCEAHRGRGKFLLEFSGKRKLFELPDVGAIYEGPGEQIFYKGVAVGEHMNGPAKFTYALDSRIALTEDRQIKEEAHARSLCCKILSACTDETVVKHSIYGQDGAEVYFWFSANRPGDTFLRVAQDLARHRQKEMNREAVAAVTKYLGKIKQTRRVIELSDWEKKAISEVVKFWHRAAGVRIDDFPITLVASLDSHSARARCLALAEDGQIWLTPECFSGEEMLRTTLFEEWLHLQHRVADETREMQDVLFCYLAKLGEKLQ